MSDNIILESLWFTLGLLSDQITPVAGAWLNAITCLSLIGFSIWIYL